MNGRIVNNPSAPISPLTWTWLYVYVQFIAVNMDNTVTKISNWWNAIQPNAYLVPLSVLTAMRITRCCRIRLATIETDGDHLPQMLGILVKRLTRKEAYSQQLMMPGTSSSWCGVMSLALVDHKDVFFFQAVGYLAPWTLLGTETRTKTGYTMIHIKHCFQYLSSGMTEGLIHQKQFKVQVVGKGHASAGNQDSGIVNCKFNRNIHGNHC